MKNIISTTGKPIEFNISGTRKLVIDTVNPTEVSDSELFILKSRLGHTISVVETAVAESVIETPVENIVTEETPEDPENIGDPKDIKKSKYTKDL